MTTNNPQAVKESNRRRASRRKPRGYVKLECRKGTIGLGKNVATTLLDLSETGARLVVSHELLAKQQVEVILTAHGVNQPVKRFGYVRWQLKLDDGKFCLGVEFEKRLDYRDWQHLATPS